VHDDVDAEEHQFQGQRNCYLSEKLQ